LTNSCRQLAARRALESGGRFRANYACPAPWEARQIFTKLLPILFLSKQILGVAVYAIGFLALDPKLLFAESSKSLPDVTVALRLLARRAPL
jgi:hypothetical protein